MATKDSVPWKLHEGAPYETGALSLGQIHVLGNRHEVPADELLTFSRKLPSYLRPNFDPEIPEHRPAKGPKGAREALKATKHLSVAGREIEKAKGILGQLIFKNMYHHTGMPNPADQYLTNLSDAADAVRKLEKYVEVMQRDNLVVFKGTADARSIRDIRREAICFAAFGLWSDLERPLTYTTDPLTSERGGKMFAFIRDVVSCVTEPMTILSDAALRDDLDRFKAIKAEYLARLHPK